MIIDDLVTRKGEWLRAVGADSDIVLSSRVRLARNLADFSFATRVSNHERREIEEQLRRAITSIDCGQPVEYLNVASLSELDRQFLVERQLISRELAGGTGPRGVAISPNESLSLMINEEDHLRLQVLRSGYTTRDCWEMIDHVDDQIEGRVSYAFSDEFGYLTACPTNVGTGMRASVLLHLPGLAITRQLDKVFRALQRARLTVRGLYGEGSQALGDFYQVSNTVTLGKSEADIIADIDTMVPGIIHFERQARQEMLQRNRHPLHDRVSRAYGTLRSAQTMSSEEATHLLSSLRLGVHLHLVEDLSIDAVNDLFLYAQPAHLQKMHGVLAEVEDRNVARAAFLRRRLDQSAK